ncbi:MAG: hypothetical protein ACLTMP_09295 [Eggerthella lenta]
MKKRIAMMGAYFAATGLLPQHLLDAVALCGAADGQQAGTGRMSMGTPTA